MGKLQQRKKVLGFRQKSSTNIPVLLIEDQNGQTEALGFHIAGNRFIVQAAEVLPGKSTKSTKIKQELMDVGVTHKTLGVSVKRFKALNLMPFVVVNKKSKEVDLYGFFFTSSVFSKAIGLAKTDGSADPSVKEWLTSKDSVYGCLSLCEIIHSLTQP